MTKQKLTTVGVTAVVFTTLSGVMTVVVTMLSGASTDSTRAPSDNSN